MNINIREKIAKFIAPGLRNDAEFRASMADEISKTVSEQITKARMAMPISINMDPKDEGYRRLNDSVMNRNLQPVEQSRMFEICYYMFKASAMFKRLAKMDKSFIFSGPIKIESSDKDVQKIINRFIKKNKLARKFPERCMWFSILGEQCWPVQVDQYNGEVKWLYQDPASIKEIYVNPLNIEERMQVEMMGSSGRSGVKYSIIREDLNVASKSYNRLVGDCFFFTINNAPNATRGVSDFFPLVDWIDSLERYGYNYLERAELMLNFVWDITLKGMDTNQIREWLRDNPPPEPGSQRAHNEQVEWNAVSPDLKATDFKSGFDMGKAFIMGAAGRPESWFGSGGKQYQTEADQSGQAPIVDLEERQKFYQEILEEVIQFVIDQAVIAKVLSPEKAEAGFTVTMPEISKKDLAKLAGVIPQLTTALAIAVSNKFIRRDTAIQIFAFVAGYLGYEVNAQEEIDAATNALEPGTEDYEALLKKFNVQSSTFKDGKEDGE
ncbi:MAG: hypothetical protein LLG40_11235 [Deltaproteobacteria bacterium]|nr:hypothetical protein [Deltaproteobacteria bacterium]